MKESNPAAPSAKALLRYQIISPYLAAEPARGERGRLLKHLAKKMWTGLGGEPVYYTAETIRSWLRRYRRGGLAALEDAPRVRTGVQVLSPELIAKVCALKREVPARSLDRIMSIVEDLGIAPAGTLRRSTLHRVLHEANLSKRPSPSGPSETDLDRFEAEAPNAL